MGPTRVIAVIIALRAVAAVPLSLWLDAAAAGLSDRERDVTESLASYSFAVHAMLGTDLILALSAALVFALSLHRPWSRVGVAAAALVILAGSAQIVFGEAIRSDFTLATVVVVVGIGGWLGVQLAASRALPAQLAIALMAVMTALSYVGTGAPLWPRWVPLVVFPVAGLVVAAMAWRTPSSGSPPPTR